LIGGILGFLLGMADYGLILKIVANAKAKNGGTVAPALKVMLFITSAVAFAIVGAFVGHQLQSGGMI
jgi:hypothetical protein